ncbi:nuclear transport factor 2 family protein [Nonomuraea sp. NPDC049400]|uniref:nuclear transport factor 2 family protein n=1 Tax=Nonomuraea sp. NPDC049400 TaxID=3364352 RepID=UPI003797ACB2
MTEQALHQRSAYDVIADHLWLRQQKALEEDLRRNYHPQVVLLSAEGVSYGHDGVRALTHVLRSYVPEADYRYHQIVVEGPYAMVEWTARGSQTEIHNGADSYVISNGRIIAQTIHYSTRSRPGQDS